MSDSNSGDDDASRPGDNSPGPFSKLTSSVKSNCGHRPLRKFFCRVLPWLSMGMFISAFLLIMCAGLFYFLKPSGGLFILSAETSRLDYLVENSARAEILLDGVLVRSNGFDVVDALKHPQTNSGSADKQIKPTESSDPSEKHDSEQAGQASGNADDQKVVIPSEFPDYFCYTGVLTPSFGTRVELAVLDGVQSLSVDAGQSVQRPKQNSSSASRRSRRRGEDTSSPTNEQGTAFEGALATLSFNDRYLVLAADHSVHPGFEAHDTDLDLLLLDEPEDSNDRLPVAPAIGDFPLSGPVIVTADPACPRASAGAPAFASRQAPITVDGPSVIGRKLRTIGDETVVDEDIPYIRGDVEIVIRQALCFERFFPSDNGVSGNQMRGCKRIYHVDTDSLSLPPGSAITGVARGGFSSDFFGQITFEDGRYAAHISTEADSFRVLRPGAGGTFENANLLSVPFLTRILLEPWLIILTTIFFTLSGLVLGILQIEDEDNLTG